MGRYSEWKQKLFWVRNVGKKIQRWQVIMKSFVFSGTNSKFLYGCTERSSRGPGSCCHLSSAGLSTSHLYAFCRKQKWEKKEKSVLFFFFCHFENTSLNSSYVDKLLIQFGPRDLVNWYQTTLAIFEVLPESSLRQADRWCSLYSTFLVNGGTRSSASSSFESMPPGCAAGLPSWRNLRLQPGRGGSRQWFQQCHL